MAECPLRRWFPVYKKGGTVQAAIPLAGYLSVERPKGGWGEYFQTPSITPVGEYRFIEQARRYEIGGTANYPGAVGLAASLRLIQQLGMTRIEKHIYKLTDYLISGLQTLGVRLVTPTAHKYRSGIVTFCVGSAAANIALMEQLLEHRILVSVRYTSQVGGVRVSCHFYNNIDEVDRLLENVEAALAARHLPVAGLHKTE